MSRSIKQHPVERLVRAYLQRFAKTSKLGRNKQVIEKAMKMIGVVLHDPCCQPAEEITLGRTEDFFLIQLTSLLNGIDERKWRESLERAKSLLNDKFNRPCCFVEVEGFGGGEDLCVGGTTTFFITDDEIGIGTTLYQNQQLELVTFSFFRDNVTGIIYEVTDGVVTGISEANCSQIIQIAMTDISASLFISNVTVDDNPLIFSGFDSFPIGIDQVGVYITNNSAPGLKTVKVFVTGTSGTASLVSVTDSNGDLQSQTFTGAGTYTFTNVFVSGPNDITAGVGVSVS